MRRIFAIISGTIQSAVGSVARLFDGSGSTMRAIASAPSKALSAVNRGARSTYGYTTETLKQGGNAIYNYANDVTAVTQAATKKGVRSAVAVGKYAQKRAFELFNAANHLVDYAIRVLAAAPGSALEHIDGGYKTLRGYALKSATATRDAAHRGVGGAYAATKTARDGVYDLLQRGYQLADKYALGYAAAVPGVALAQLRGAYDTLGAYLAAAYERLVAALPERKLTPAETVVEEQMAERPTPSPPRERKIVVTPPPPAAAPVRAEVVQQPQPPSIDQEQVRAMIREQLELYDADKTGIADYALESSGGELLGIGCTREYTKKSRLQSIFGIPLYYAVYGPRTVIQASRERARNGARKCDRLFSAEAAA